MNDTIILIPARIGSTRLPRKPLLKINGREMILHVWDKAQNTKAEKVVVATDSQEIAEVLHKEGAEVIITNPSHQSGTDRIYEALNILDKEKSYEYIINLQGDLPNITSDVINLGIDNIRKTDADILTYCREIDNPIDVGNPNIVKIATHKEENDELNALYFSRSPIPYGADTYLEHIGIYVYKRDALDRFVSMDPSTLETTEKLEQLRALGASMKINLILVDDKIISIDTIDDVERLSNISDN
ncbi:MAG: 3-deoxy-manno-octulosonate cytidylyltransferase [Pelagibacteraceae bacterium]